VNPVITIHPVIMAVPEPDRRLKGREKVAALRRRAREALACSARFSAVRLGPLEKDDLGAPVPSNGVHWSLTHKVDFVAAVTAPHPIGIDIERIKPVSPALRRRLADEREWALSPEETQALFFRYWTAKEAVLKAVGQGMLELARCRIQAIVDQDHVIVTHRDSKWTVAQYWGTKGHIVAVTAGRVEIQWHQID
jgi:4'-phosphopantetheinyl transferase